MKNFRLTRVYVIALLSVILYLPFGCGLVASLGKNPDGQALAVLRLQPNFRDGEFHNLHYPDDTAQVKRVGMMKLLFGNPDSVTPLKPMPWVKTDLKTLPDDKPVVVWFGHSSMLIKHHGTSILIDPNFSTHAGPIPGLIQAFKGTTEYSVVDMPPIDAVIISHNHYDHLDYPTIRALLTHVKKIVVPLGVGSHLKYWGYQLDQIEELNWGQSYVLPDGTTITATPARHGSKRMFGTNKTLWASYVIKTGDYRIFYSGDSGFGYHFKNIGSQYGPFDLALLECGQYGPKWPHSHMLPGQTAQAAFDLRAAMMMPVHWAKFAESSHKWNEPIRLLLPAAQKLGVNVTVPEIGEPYMLGSELLQHDWWEF